MQSEVPAFFNVGNRYCFVAGTRAVNILNFASFLAETNRPILRRVEHLETSDYINACLVDVS